MRKSLFASMLLAVLLLAACGGAPATAPAATDALPETGTQAVTAAPAETMPPAATEAAPTAAVTEPPAATTEAAATEAPAETPAAGGVVVYRFVPEESNVSYEVNETFLDNNRIGTAIGVTQEISGEITVDSANPQNSSLGPIEVDISTFSSDSSRRDGAIRDRFLESARFPIASFVATEISGLPEQIEAGVDYPLQISGDLTVREMSLPVTFEAVVRQENGQLVGTAETTILMSAFGFGPIEILGMLQTEDEVKVKLEFVARPE